MTQMPDMFSLSPSVTLIKTNNNNNDNTLFWSAQKPYNYTPLCYKTRGSNLETPDNFLGPKTILGAQYSPIAIQFFLILKAKF